MGRDENSLRCRTCGETFVALRSASGRWRLALEGKPPSPVCRQHRDGQLCRHAVDRTHDRLRRQPKPIIRRRAAVFLTLVPPRRAVPFGRLRAVDAQDELRSLRRVLPSLPPGIVAAGWLDVGLRDVPAADGGRQQWWLPHLHLVAFGMDRRAARKWLGSPYRPTTLVPLPKWVADAPTPLNALGYALKHADDVRADVVLANPTRPRRHVVVPQWLKPGERAELRQFMARHRISDLLLLIGRRRFGARLGRA